MMVSHAAPSYWWPLPESTNGFTAVSSCCEVFLFVFFFFICSKTNIQLLIEVQVTCLCGLCYALVLIHSFLKGRQKDNPLFT